VSLAPIAGFEHVHEPAGAGEARTLLLLHGTGGNEHDLVPLGRRVAPGWGLLSPRGRTLERGMPRFFRRLAEGVFDLEDLRVRTAELGSFVDASATTYGFDRAGVAALGYSNGANIAASLMLTADRPFAAAILLRPMVPFEPTAPTDLAGVGVLVRAGRRDPIGTPAISERLATLLRGARAEVDLQWHEGGHELAAGDAVAAAAWLEARAR